MMGVPGNFSLALQADTLRESSIPQMGYGRFQGRMGKIMAALATAILRICYAYRVCILYCH